MQAITTRFLSPTNFRGSRVKVQCDAGSLVVAWDYSKGPDDNHDAACAELVKRLGWDTYGAWIGGTLAPCEKSARCYVCVTALGRARNILWPNGAADTEWSAETLTELADVLRVTP